MKTSWIDLHALWKIVVLGLLAGAGLPALFAVGIRSMSPSGSASASASRGGLAGATACFTLILAAVGYGIYLIVDGS